MVEVFVLCRSQAYIDRWTEHAKLHPGVDFRLWSNYTSYFTYMKDVLAAATTPNPILCHDDVWFGVGFFKHIPSLLSDLEEYAPNWGVVGNAGVDIEGSRRYRYLRDPHDGPNRSEFLKPVVGVDGNIMMLNKTLLDKHKIDVPDIGGFHGYDMILAFECLRVGLLPIADHRLALYHESPGDGKSFFAFIKEERFKSYMAARFINHRIPNLNDTIYLDNVIEYDYLIPGKQGDRKDIVELFDTALLTARSKHKPSVTIYCRSQFNRAGLLTRAVQSFAAASHQTKDLFDLSVCILTDKPQEILDSEVARLRTVAPGLALEGRSFTIRPGRHSRADLLIHAVETSSSDYIWFVDDDDYVFPNAVAAIGRYLASNGRAFLVADCMRYEETWKDTSDANTSVPLGAHTINQTYGNHVYLSFSGDNFVPVCGCIFPVKPLRAQLEGMDVFGDYSEDYFLLMLTLCAPKIEIVVLDTIISGISIRGTENTVTVSDRSHWNLSYATFMTELLNSDKFGSAAFWSLARPTPHMLRGVIAESRFAEYPRFIRFLLHGCYSLVALQKMLAHPRVIHANIIKCMFVLKHGGIKQLLVKISQFGQKKV